MQVRCVVALLEDPLHEWRCQPSSWRRAAAEAHELADREHAVLVRVELEVVRVEHLCVPTKHTGIGITSTRPLADAVLQSSVSHSSENQFWRSSS